MNLLPKFFCVLSCCSILGFSYGQTGHIHSNHCGASPAELQLIQANPQMAAQIHQADEALEEHTRNFIANQNSRAAGPILVIPTVFHILHENGPENILDSDVHQAMENLNEVFNKENDDLVDVISAFQSIIGDAEIEFRLARKDPNGNNTDGIVRYFTSQTNSADDLVKNGRSWPRNMYLNVWVVSSIDIGSGPGVAGYSYRPSAAAGIPTYDGVMVEYTYVGDNGNTQTLAHEIGHWMNLSHPWGGTNDPGLASNCNTDDNVADTPNTEGHLGGCNLSANTCGSLDNIQNIMDYAGCPVMFTQGQVDRMRAAMFSNTAQRSNVWSTPNLAATGTDELWEADFTAAKQVVCRYEEVYFQDQSFYGQNAWDWTFNGGNPAQSSDQNPSVIYNTPGIYNISLEVSDGLASQSVTYNQFIMVTDLIGTHTPYNENFETNDIPGGHWFPVNPDKDQYGWEKSTTAGYDDNTSAKMNNFGNNGGRIDDLISGTYDVSNLSSATLTFRLAYAQSSSGVGNDILRLYTSNDCGSTWSLRWIQAGTGMATVGPQSSDWEPSAPNEWAEIQVDNFGSHMSDNLQFKFEFASFGGNNLYIDNINLEGPFKDAPVLESPDDGAVNRPEDVLINWKAIGNVDSYEYEIDTDPNFNTGNLITGTTQYIGPSSKDVDTEFLAESLTHGQTYHWRVRYNQGGSDSPWSEVWEFTIDPTGVGFAEALAQSLQFKIFPNPTDNVSNIAFVLNESQEVKLGVYDLMGRNISQLVDTRLESGKYRYQLNSNQWESGMYFVRMEIDGKEFSKKLIVR